MTGSSPVLALGAAVLFGFVGCRGGRTERGYAPATGGDADRGAHLIVQADCGSCHTIPGIRSARGVVGPPLNFFSRRTYIAGELPNTPDNLVRWMQDPPAFSPKTAMPRTNLDEHQARDVAAYLYTLR